MQSLAPSLSLNNLIPFSIIFSSVYLSRNKNSTPPDWQKQKPSGQKLDPSGLAKIPLLRIGKNKTPPDWQNWDPSGLAKLGLSGFAKFGTLRIGKIGTPTVWQKWDPSGLGPLRVCKSSFSVFQNFHPIPFRIRFPMLICCLY